MKRYIVLALLISCFSLTALSNTYNLPQLGTPGSRGLTLAEENALGIRFMQLVKSQLPLMKDPIITQYVSQLGQRLAQHSDSPERNFHFFVVKDNTINAFAGPGGYIGINTGLILTTDSEGELAGVMAHEIAHVTQRHIARTIESMQDIQFANIAAMIASVAIGAASPQAAGGLASAASAGSTQSLINYTRSHEKEADRVGMHILADSGYPPRDMAGFFEHMQHLGRLNDTSQMPEILSTHPLTPHRLAEAEARAKSIQVRNPRPPDPYFNLIQARTLALTTRNTSKLARRLDKKFKQSNKPASQYAYALVLTDTGQLAKASQILNNLLKSNPDQVLFLIAKAHNLQAQHKTKAALQLLKETYKTHPKNSALILEYAHLLFHNQHYQAAANLLQHNSSLFSANELYLALLAQTQGKAGELAQAYLTRAQLLVLNHRLDAALTQLQQAKQFAKDQYMKARVEHETKKIKREQSFNERFER